MMQKEYRVDPELQKVMPSLTDEERIELENSLLKDGFKGAPIIVWGDIIIDGHNRYELCKKHDIPFAIQEMDFDSREEVIQWMIRAQLGRRNLIPAQRAALVKRFRPELEQAAKERQGKRNDLVKNTSENIPPKMVESSKDNKNQNEVTGQLASMANMGKETFRKAEKVLDSENEELKEEMILGEKSIDAAYKELQRLEKGGRTIEVPNQDVVSSSDGENVIEDTVTKTNASRLKEIQERYASTITTLQRDVHWLTNKEFFDNEGDELTSKIHSQIKNFMSRLQELGDVISVMRADDCGDENVIILEK